ncbi:hypothetical protein G7Y89_g8812 [Cudoniella acicularis]|uniref:F-box domain-containing protein n=1 Tax=Cudoniella acicularis TaxID=354080 RepID=A0A8H4W379_9HELO|nr:hypothetical protein G7Y89_g8812 [Cudoniella acicularis]
MSNQPNFLMIPVELRRLIYKELFTTTTTKHGFSSTSWTHTSVLRTSRQLYKEARPIMLRNILLHFSSTCKFLDCMTDLPADDISQLRYIRTKSFPFPLYADEDAFSYTTYFFGALLPLFPGLQLDLLTVEDCFHDKDVNDGFGDVGTYLDIQELITTKGWKELHYITPTTEWISSKRDHRRCRSAQPATWNAMLQEQDGETSEAKVEMWIGNEPSVKGQAENPETRMPCRIVPSNNIQEAYVYDEREMIVIAKRGNGASYIEDGMELDKGIEHVFQMTWQDVKQSGLVQSAEGDPCAHL